MNPHAQTPTPGLPPTASDAPSSPPPPDPSTRSPDAAMPMGAPPLRPTHPSPRPLHSPRHRPNLFRPLALVVLVAVAFAVGTPSSPVRSIGWALALSVLSGALVTTAARRPAAIWLGITAIAFIPWLGVRMSPWLTSINLLMAGGLLLASLGLPAAGSLRVTTAHHLTRLARSFGGLPFGPSHLAHHARRTAASGVSGGLRRLLPSMLIGVTALTAALIVLASGDALLASFFDIDGVVGTVASRVLAALLGVASFALLIGAIHVPGSSDAAPRIWSPPVLPTLFGIGGLSVAIGAYAATQTSAAVLGADFVEGRTGLTYAEYARGGFFQMVVVALVSVAVIGVSRGVLRTAPEAVGRLRVGAAVLTIGVVVTVVSAIVKLSVYADAFGLTMLRVYTVVFACWLGLLALLAFATLMRPAASWFAPVLLGSMCVGAFAMNIANPERIVAEHNLDRAESTGKLDVGYLSSLSLDAAPTVFARLDSIDAEYEQRTRDGVEVVDAGDLLALRWCGRVIGEPSGNERPPAVHNDGLSFNLARGAALDSAADQCP